MRAWALGSEQAATTPNRRRTLVSPGLSCWPSQHARKGRANWAFVSGVSGVSGVSVGLELGNEVEKNSGSGAV